MSEAEPQQTPVPRQAKLELAMAEYVKWERSAATRAAEFQHLDLEGKMARFHELLCSPDSPCRNQPAA